MGLFSFLSKNKQDRTTEDSGRFTRAEDDAIGERARSKRASHNADGGRRRSATDPVLPEKKRARRRLVGAIALALAAAVGLPMLLDSEPKPLAGDIAIQIPSKEKAAPLPMPADPVAAADSVDTGEEIVEPSEAAADDRRIVTMDTMDTTPPAATQAPATPPAAPSQVEQVRTEPAARDIAHEPVKPEPKAAPKPEPKVAEAKPADKAPPKPAAKPSVARPEDKPVPRTQPGSDDSRALAILENKQAAKQEAAAPIQRFVVQVAALASPEKVAELQARLRGAGIATFTQKQTTPSGALIRVRAGPLNKDDAEKLRTRLQGLGLSGTLVPL